MTSFIGTVALLLIAIAAILALLAAVAALQGPPSVLHVFAGSLVLLQRRDGGQISGILRPTATGLELQSDLRPQADAPPAPASILVYAVEYDAIERIQRLSAGGGRLPARRTNPARRLWYRLGDAVDNLRGRTGQIVRWPAVPEHALAPPPVLGYDGNRWDPMLEHCLGQRVVFQCVLGNMQFERMGVLSAYDQHFLLFSQVLLPRSVSYSLSQPDIKTEVVNIRRQGLRMEIHNRSPYPLLLDELHVGEQVRELGMMIAAGASFSMHLEQASAANDELRCQIVEQVDLILPRRTTLIRYRTAAADILPLFDAGFALQPVSNWQSREEELRWTLRNRPHDAMTAASLGRLLYQQGRWAEAESYWQQALQSAQALPDAGQRVRLELSQLRRRLGKAQDNQST